MNYTMTKPCDACPFRKGSGFSLRRLLEFASGEFPCHKTAAVVEDGESGVSEFRPKANGKSLHCAGALIFNELRGQPSQMMRICGRIGMYDARKLDLTKGPAQTVGTTAADFKAPTARRSAQP